MDHIGPCTKSNQSEHYINWSGHNKTITKQDQTKVTGPDCFKVQTDPKVCTVHHKNPWVSIRFAVRIIDRTARWTHVCMVDVSVRYQA